MGPEPLALALSGGGDSRALLSVAAKWAVLRARPLIAFTVDHRLNPQSEDWTRAAGKAACDEGVEWAPLIWAEASAGAGVQARARQARHTLLADAARAAGARFILLGHTLNDVAENRWMQQDGGTLGDLREWSPSPIWPQGRGLVLLRPMLGERREVLRDYLVSQAKGWIDDPANEDSHYQRVRARKALCGNAAPVEPAPLKPFEWTEGPLAQYGVLEFSREALVKAGGRALAVALVSASGQARLPRGDRLEALRQRLAGGEIFTAVLSGARLEAQAQKVLILREAGEMSRSGLTALSLQAGGPAVWDGRFEITIERPDCHIVPARGLMAKLSDEDRVILANMPVSARPIQPVLVCPRTASPVLAYGKAKLLSLVATRFRLNCPVRMGETTQEAVLFASTHGEKRSTTLFSV